MRTGALSRLVYRFRIENTLCPSAILVIPLEADQANSVRIVVLDFHGKWE